MSDFSNQKSKSRRNRHTKIVDWQKIETAMREHGIENIDALVIEIEVFLDGLGAERTGLSEQTLVNMKRGKRVDESSLLILEQFFETETNYFIKKFQSSNEHHENLTPNSKKNTLLNEKEETQFLHGYSIELIIGAVLVLMVFLMGIWVGVTLPKSEINADRDTVVQQDYFSTLQDLNKDTELPESNKVSPLSEISQVKERIFNFHEEKAQAGWLPRKAYIQFTAPKGPDADIIQSVLKEYLLEKWPELNLLEDIERVYKRKYVFHGEAITPPGIDFLIDVETHINDKNLTIHILERQGINHNLIWKYTLNPDLNKNYIRNILKDAAFTIENLYTKQTLIPTIENLYLWIAGHSNAPVDESIIGNRESMNDSSFNRYTEILKSQMNLVQDRYDFSKAYIPIQVKLSDCYERDGFYMKKEPELLFVNQINKNNDIIRLKLPPIHVNWVSLPRFDCEKYLGPDIFRIQYLTAKVAFSFENTHAEAPDSSIKNDSTNFGSRLIVNVLEVYPFESNMGDRLVGNLIKN